MTEPVVVNNVYAGIRQVIKEADLSSTVGSVVSHINDRIFLREALPPTTPTFPFITVQDLGDVRNIMSGDGGEVINTQQQYQVSVWQESLKKQDSALPGNLARLLRGIPLYVRGQRAQIRFVSMNRIPTPDDETAVQHAVTIAVFMPVEAI